MDKKQMREEIRNAVKVSLNDNGTPLKGIKLNQYGELPYHLDPKIKVLDAVGSIIFWVWCILVLYGVWWVFVG